MFSIKEAVMYGYHTLKDNFRLSLFTTAIILVLAMLSGMDDARRGIFMSILGILATIVLIIAKIGYSKIYLRLNDGEKPEVMDIWKEYRLFWKYVGFFILMFIAVGIGFVALVLPGIYLAIRFSFGSIILVDNRIGPIEAMKESWRITKDDFFKILLFWIVIGLINIIGIILFGIGVLISMPITVLATTYVYRKLSREKAGITVVENTIPQPGI